MEENIEDYRIGRGPIGTVSSLSCVNFALTQTVADQQQELDTNTIEALKKHFYVDYC